MSTNFLVKKRRLRFFHLEPPVIGSCNSTESIVHLKLCLHREYHVITVWSKGIEGTYDAKWILSVTCEILHN